MGKLKCTILNFHEGDDASLDDDNMVKPIRDALNGLIYEDDSQISYSETIHISIDAPIKIRKASSILLAAYGKGEVFLYVGSTMSPILSNSPSDAMERDDLSQVARRYREEGYEVVLEPRADQLPSFLGDFRPDLIATRGGENIVVEVKANRIELSEDRRLAPIAGVVDAQPGWRLDVVVLERLTEIEKAAQGATEPSDDQLAQILRSAEELASTGYMPYAYVVAWGGLEAAMRRVRAGAEFDGKATPDELIRTLYGNGFLGREQFDRLMAAYKIRNQVTHGLVPRQVDPDSLRFVIEAARELASGKEAIASL